MSNTEDNIKKLNEASSLSSFDPEMVFKNSADQIITPGLPPEGIEARPELPAAPAKAAKPTFKPKLSKTVEERLAEAEHNLNTIAERTGVKVKAAPATPAAIDFTKISERDIYDMDIPMELVDHELPQYMDVVLKDGNYVARWVHVHPARLGPMMAKGFTYVTKEDLAEDLKLAIEPDENGVFKYIDVYLMKCSKAKYFGALKRNHLQAEAMTNPRKSREIGRQFIQNDLQKQHPGDYKEAVEKNTMEVFL